MLLGNFPRDLPQSALGTGPHRAVLTEVAENSVLKVTEYTIGFTRYVLSTQQWTFRGVAVHQNTPLDGLLYLLSAPPISWVQKKLHLVHLIFRLICVQVKGGMFQRSKSLRKSYV
jgi:hypothetical protein